MQSELVPTPREVITPRHLAEAQKGPLAGDLGSQANELYSQARVTAESLEGAKVFYDEAHANNGPGGLEGFKWTKDLVTTTALRGFTRVMHEKAVNRAAKHYRRHEQAYRQQAALDARAEGVIINN